MKKLKNILWILALAAFIFQACDKVEDPYLRDDNGNGGGDTTEAVRKVLLEDYTGHTCVNCPRAAIVAHDLKEQYEEQLVVIAVHAGYFAEPKNSGLYTTDFTTDMGDDLDSEFGISLQGNPNGMVNRVVNGDDQVIGDAEWPAAVGVELAKPAISTIEITKDYNSNSRALSTSLKVGFLADLSGVYRVCVVVTEDSIVAPQMNSTAIGPSPDWEDYVHMHVLRGGINGTWGSIITDEEIVAGSEYSVACDDFNIENDWDDEQCTIVAYVFSQETYEIIQAEEIKLID
ncbi:MAG: hypothetical protein DRJ05_02850 [Bacteroidetes bacterium]|nr:MAG: hypothetical protein DRJ05_02850 [Bacteroidota bacterium]